MKVSIGEGIKDVTRPTQRAPDVWDSAAFSGIFLASSFSCSEAESTPAHTQVTHTVGRLPKFGGGRQRVHHTRVQSQLDKQLN